MNIRYLGDVFGLCTTIVQQRYQQDSSEDIFHSEVVKILYNFTKNAN